MVPPIVLANDEWRDIAARAATLVERIGAHRAGWSGQVESSEVGSSERELVEQWRRAAAFGDAAKFDRRLAALGVSDADLAGLFAAPDPGDHVLPSWCAMLVRCGDSEVRGGPLPLDDRPELLPELTAFLIAPAFGDIAVEHPTLIASAQCLLARDLVVGLQRHLAGLLAPVVAAEFGDARLGLVAAGVDDPWRHWMQGQRDGGLGELWLRYPALARLVGTTLELWVARVGELLVRAATDAADIAELFGCEGLVLTRVSQGLSDRHRGGATVAKCTFEAPDGTALDVVYKPRNLGAEVVFANFIEWLNQRGVDLGAPMRFLSRGDYGWVECVAAEPARHDEEVDQYYRRCGVFAAMLFALGATDCTTENLMAAGARPVVLDAETLLQPRLSGGHGRPNREPPPSVLDTLLLPRWMPIQGRVLDLSAMGTDDPACQPRVPKLRWRDAGTADAHLVLESVESLTRNSDLLGPDGRTTKACEHQAQILRGFDEGWNVIAIHREELFAAEGPLVGLQYVEVRVILRMTAMYVRMLESSLDPRHLTDGLSRSLHFEPMARLWLNRGGTDAELAIVDSECEQAEQGDVPIFTTRGDSVTLATSNSHLDFTESPYDRARTRIDAMSPTEHLRQRTLITAALSAAPTSTNLVRHVGPPSVSHQIRKAAWGEAAGEVVRRVSEGVVEVPGGLVLVSLNANRGSLQWSIGPLDASLGHGCTGVALSLLVAADTYADPVAHDLAVGLLAASVPATIETIDRVAALRGTGFERGLSGLAFGWQEARDRVESADLRGLLDDAVATINSRLSADGTAHTGHAAGMRPSDQVATHCDALVGGIAGRLMAFAVDGAESGGDQAGLADGLAQRTIDDHLRLGVPTGCPIPAYGLNVGLAGVLLALATSDSAHSSPRLILPRLTD